MGKDKWVEIKKLQPLDHLTFNDTHLMAKQLFEAITDMTDKINEIIEVVNSSHKLNTLIL